MRGRFALVALATAFTLAGCDIIGGSDDSISGYWEGTAQFSVDTVLVDQNVRITADYEFLFAFDLEQDDGLVTGRIIAMREGDTIYREAGYAAETTQYQEGLVTAEDEVFGTFIAPELEVDVPGNQGYSDDLWTFDVVGSRAESSNYIEHSRVFTRAVDGREFSFALRSDEPFTMYLKDRPSDLETQAPTKASGAQRDAFRAVAAPRLQRSEQ